MVNKIFGFYKNDDDYAAVKADKLVVEVGKTHLACLVVDEAKHINALEWFKYAEDDFKEFNPLFDDIKQSSKLLRETFSETDIFINTNQNLWLGKGLVQDAMVEDYLNALLGKVTSHNYHQDEIADSAGLVNAYRVPGNLIVSLHDSLQVNKVEHSYSRLLQKTMHLKNLPHNYMQVLLYDAEVILTVFIKGRFQLMQSYGFQMPDDVFYHMLNACKQLAIEVDDLIVKVSGFIDAHSGFYNQLTRIFKNVAIESISSTKINLQTGNNPVHYFTPLINLAL